MKSPLIIGADVQAIADESLAILKNKWLIAVNQDALGVQGTLRSASTVDGSIYELHERMRKARAFKVASQQSVNVTANMSTNTTKPATVADGTMLQSMAKCSFGFPAVQTQQWAINTTVPGIMGGPSIHHQPTDSAPPQCLTRTTASSTTGGLAEVVVAACSLSANPLQGWDVGRVIYTTQVSLSQVKDPRDAASCLAFNGTGTSTIYFHFNFPTFLP